MTILDNLSGITGGKNKMHKRYSLIILFFVPLLLQCVNKLERYIDAESAYYGSEWLIEPVEQSFSTIPGSEHFVEQFSLTDSEQDLIGGWHLNSDFATVTGTGPGTPISFLPNRYFCVYKSSSNELDSIKYIVGKWKVEKKRLKLQFICRLRVVDPRARNNNDRLIIEYYDDNAYYPIHKVQKYERYFFNDK
ncbi:MAG: hypothetical protein LBI06_06625, partial [Treponema sp.]|nr:hypothetical protein [Treponema sp.]